jgi:ribosome-associated protein
MFNEEALQRELDFKASRSSGSGGQHVNKVATKVELSFNISNSSVLTEGEKQQVLLNLKYRLTKEGVLVLHCDETRSQHKNKALVTKRFFELIKDALVVQKERIPTKIPKSIIRKRLKSKQKQAEKKANRKRPNVD